MLDKIVKNMPESLYDGPLNVAYGEDFIEKCFVAWHTMGRPSSKKLLESSACPVDEHGRKPSHQVLDTWARERSWRERADVIDAKASTKIDNELVALKVSMLREQASQARAIRLQAFAHLLENGFDSSASAVAAFVKSSELERITLGMSKMMERLAEMDDDEVLQTVKELAERAGANIIDVAEIPEESEDADTD